VFIQNIQQGILTKSGDALRITAVSSITGQLSIVTRSITIDGVEKIGNFSINLTSVRSNQNIDIQLDAGTLISVLCFIGSNVLRGQVFVHGLIRRGDTNFGQYLLNIISNYVFSSNPVCFPFTPLVESYGGQGYLGRTTASGQAGASINVNSNSRWRIITAYVSLTSDATVGNRIVVVNFQNNSGAIGSIVSPIMQAASLSYVYYLGDYAQGTAISSQNDIRLKLPLNIFLDQISSGVISAANAGTAGGSDTLNLVVFYEEWLNA
jgi:hypothetical protein